MKVNLIALAIIALIILVIGIGLLVYTVYLDELNEKLQLEQFGFYDPKVCLLTKEQLLIPQIFIPIGLLLSFGACSAICFAILQQERE